MSNSGVDVNDIRYLMDYQQWATPGELQLIETQTASNPSALDFLSIKEDIYNVHFMTVTNFQPASDNHYIAYRLYESGT